ncbi:Cof-type HAD-IIB family hydrolase [Macrococcus armenti]|uniref:HAD family hydrolase n=1 Tax=Macrococcus armenti TaxID=2875764 RepID=UPI001CCBFC50|nr:HAD family hydrolase [Macrococcus armenti]UBH08489.1 Cof-type HAD-IIB family hydrolase [Macrococcus armenti]UBH10775.1 Cof-type HAD-IIB family hydrolase [Macrococcus armenti]UBH15255.1 Cof-type HAD-IIB family hydrolase [Macrococcus armenti]UBH17614.1 Cof-type HAD-IIB family hydrolase [Macrococcus armenti]UBH19880.1 Cof-type HAD-IIB family hydrolase [Macrococcus armenti]
MVKLIATDMDGTLLNSAHEVSEENIKAIQYAQSKGVTVAIATGRAFYEANTPVKPTGLKVPFICLNGAEVRDEDFNIIYTSKLNNEQIKRITNILKQHDLYYQVYTSARIYTEDKEKDLQIYIDIAEKMGHTPDVEKIRRSIQKRIDNGSLKEVQNYDEIYERDGEIVLKFLAFSSDLDKIDAAKEALASYNSLAVSSSSRGNIEITHNDAQKGIALQAICEQLNITMDEVMAIGDNLNDVSMLERVKYSFAMSNGAEEVKQVAKFIAGDNEESGVGRAIMQVMNGEIE